MPGDGTLAAPDPAYGRFRTEIAKLPVEPLLRMQGYRDPARIRPRVRDIATKAAALAQTLAAPDACYRRVAIRSCTPDCLDLDGGVRFHSARFARVFAGCREVVAFVLTLGPALDAETERMTAAEEIVEALFLEMAGWLAVERATKALALHVAERVRNEGLGPTRRLGPGYVDWPLDEQAGLFALLKDAPLPVKLLDSCAMIPKKSRSGLYGLRPLD
jgi:hypothetical protein